MTHPTSQHLRDLLVRAKEAIAKREQLVQQASMNALTSKEITQSFFKQRAFNLLSNRLKKKYGALNSSISSETKHPAHQQEVERIARSR